MSAEKMSVQDIVSAIESLTVLELAELVETLKDKFGVTGAVPVAAAPVAGAGAAPAEAEAEEKTSFDVVLVEVPANAKIKVLKEIRSLTGLGLKEAKELIENLPKPVKEGVEKEEAEKIKSALEGLGAKVEIK